MAETGSDQKDLAASAATGVDASTMGYFNPVMGYPPLAFGYPLPYPYFPPPLIPPPMMPLPMMSQQPQQEATSIASSASTTPTPPVRVVVVPKGNVTRQPIPTPAPPAAPNPMDFKEGRGTVAFRQVKVLQPTPVALDETAEYCEMQCDDNYNLNPMLLNHIVESPYSHTLGAMTTVKELLEEVRSEVTHLEPYATTKSTRLPSTAFCILYRLFVIRVTVDQLSMMVRHQLPLVRGVGFLFVRIVMPPGQIWDWFGPYMSDNTPIAASGNKEKKSTVSQFLRGLIEDHKYYGTMLRRIPLQIQRDMMKKIEVRDLQRKRAEGFEALRDTVTAGRKLEALFEDGKTYPVLVEQVLENGNFLIRWLDYNYSEEVNNAIL
eukprot:g8270.t1